MSAVNITLSFTGAVEFAQKFKNTMADLQPALIGGIIDSTLAQVEAEAKSAAPVRTGRLRASIVHYMANELSGVCEVLVPYAAVQESRHHYFQPAAMHGKALMISTLQKYIRDAATGAAIKPPSAPSGSRTTPSHFSNVPTKARPHRYTAKRVGPTGKTIYTYGAGKESVGRRFKTYHPGTRKRFPQRRISGRR